MPTESVGPGLRPCRRASARRGSLRELLGSPEGRPHMPKRFTLPEAQSLIPSVDPLLRKAIECKAVYEEAEREIQSFTQRILLMGGIVVNREPVLSARDRRNRASE